MGGSIRGGAGGGEGGISRSLSPTPAVGQLYSPNVSVGAGNLQSHPQPQYPANAGGNRSYAPPGEQHPPAVPRSIESSENTSSPYGMTNGKNGMNPSSGGGHARPSMTPAEYDYEQRQRTERDRSTAMRNPSTDQDQASLRVNTNVGTSSQQQQESGRSRGVQLTESYAPNAKVSPTKPKFAKPPAPSTESGSGSGSGPRSGHRKNSTMPHPDDHVNIDRTAGLPTSNSQPQPVSTSNGEIKAPGNNKLPFFERYRQMTSDSSTSKHPAGTSTRTIPGSSNSLTPEMLPRQLSRDGEVMGGGGGGISAVFDDMEEVDSPIALRLEEVEDELSSLPWARESMSEQQGQRSDLKGRTTKPTLDNDYRPHHNPKQEKSLRHGHNHDQSGEGSLSSLDQATADRMNIGQTALLTPSTSIDDLDRKSRGDGNGGFQFPQQSKQADMKPKFTTTIPVSPELNLPAMPSSSSTSMKRPPIVTRQESLDEGMLSPNIGYSSSSRYRDRDSSASSLLAPSDSISTPGLNTYPGLGFDIIKGGLPFVKGNKANGNSNGNGKSGRMCQKCGESLKGKRYIESDGVSLCEKDWKEIYLPKVSSAR